MPAKSEKQRLFMAMAYNDPSMGISKEVAKKFMKKPAKGYKEGGKLPDLTGDGKVTQADVLKGRGVFKKGGTVKKYQAGGMSSSPRPKMRPEDMEGSRMAPKRSMRPRRRPEDMEMDMSPDTAVGRGNRASMREAEDMRSLAPGMMMGGKVKKMQAGGKVRGYGKARGAKACKMM